MHWFALALALISLSSFAEDFRRQKVSEGDCTVKVTANDGRTYSPVLEPLTNWTFDNTAKYLENWTNDYPTASKLFSVQPFISPSGRKSVTVTYEWKDASLDVSGSFTVFTNEKGKQELNVDNADREYVKAFDDNTFWIQYTGRKELLIELTCTFSGEAHGIKTHPEQYVRTGDIGRLY